MRTILEQFQPILLNIFGCSSRRNGAASKWLFDYFFFAQIMMKFQKIWVLLQRTFGKKKMEKNEKKNVKNFIMKPIVCIFIKYFNNYNSLQNRTKASNFYQRPTFLRHAYVLISRPRFKMFKKIIFWVLLKIALFNFFTCGKILRCSQPIINLFA